MKGEKRVFDLNTADAAVSFLLSDSFFSKFKYYRINIVSGGEPFLDKTALFQFVTVCERRFKENNKKVYIWLSTNGTLFSPEDVSFLSEHNVGFGISLDGVAEDNDSLRVYADGSGCYKDVRENISEILAADFLPPKAKQLWGLLVLTQKNLDIYKNVTHLKDIGFSTIQMRFVRTKDPSLSLSSLPSQKIAKTLIDFLTIAFTNAINGSPKLIHLIANQHDYIGKIILRLLLRVKTETRCSIGSYMFSFAADGNIYPCDCFVGNPDFVLGNFYSSLDLEKLTKYRDISVHVRPKCKHCWAKFVCGGDCYHNSHIQNNNLLVPDATYCEIILPVIEATIANVNKYQKENPTGYNKTIEYLRIREALKEK